MVMANPSRRNDITGRATGDEVGMI
ncbi:Hypothetical protein Cp106_1047 [Corynebacterium pseudotuberculosis 1/06-A]|nr:Hypothetical protein Cp106_1047 [Corynebacterium pseudotuberculosis 1/06-A]